MLLDFPAPRIRVYPIHTGVAEKLEAMVTLGTATTRMKDFFDLWYLSRNFSFEGQPLQVAVARTFERRKTAIPSATLPVLTADFLVQGAELWKHFIERNKLPVMSFATVISELRAFLMPTLDKDGPISPLGKWDPGQGWS